jgi:hypothetical protein
MPRRSGIARLLADDNVRAGKAGMLISSQWSVIGTPIVFLITDD